MASKGSAYQSFLQRSGPTRLGEVEWPKSKAGALTGKKFLVTGVMETIDRQELIDTIKESGGHVMSGMSKNLDYLIVGRDAGPSKLEKAAQMGLNQLTEDETLSLLKDVLEGNKVLEPKTTVKKPPAKKETKKPDTKKSKARKSSESEEETRPKKATKKVKQEKSKKSTSQEEEEDVLGDF